MSQISDQSQGIIGQHGSSWADELARVREFIASLELGMSNGLANHAVEVSHEDLQQLNHEHHASSIATSTTSRGTISPVSSIRSAAERLHPFIPPTNYGAVLPHMIYRSGYPKPENYDFIKDLKIKSIVTLVPEPIPDEYQAFMDEAGIQHFRVHIHANKGGVRVESCQMNRALRLMLDRSNHPMLIHCNKGKHRTGCTVACFRRILGFEMDSIRTEYHTYAGPKARFMDEVFFENFELDSAMWFAKGDGWVAKEPINVTPLSPPASPEMASSPALMLSPEIPTPVISLDDAIPPLTIDSPEMASPLLHLITSDMATSPLAMGTSNLPSPVSPVPTASSEPSLVAAKTSA